MRATIAPTWALSARPLPDTAALTSLGVCSATGRPRRAAQTRAIPLAWAVPITVLTSERAKTRSTATASGRCSSSQASMPFSMLTSRWATGRSAEVRTTPTSTSRQRSPGLALDHADAAPGQPGVDAEHAHEVTLPSEQLFGRHANRVVVPNGARHAAESSAGPASDVRLGHWVNPGVATPGTARRSPPTSSAAPLELERDRARPAAAPAAGPGPGAVRRRQLPKAESQPSGVRLVFRTRATEVELDTLRVVTRTPGCRRGPTASTTCCVDGELAAQATSRTATSVELDLDRGTAETRRGPVGTVRFVGLPDRDKTVELWLPWSETTDLVHAAHRRTRRGPGAAERAPRSGCTTAARSARAPSRRARARRGRRSPPPRGGVGPGQPRARGQRAARPVHRPRRCGTPRPTWSASRSASTW